jgi:hypothetical protein
MPSKQNSADKIDGLTALIIAMARLLVEPVLSAGPELSFV